MKKILNIFVVSFFTIGFAYSQNNLETINYNDLLKYKVDQNRFEFGWLNNVFSGIPCFRDYSNNNIQTQLVDTKSDSIIYKSSETHKNGLIIIPKIIVIDKTNKLLHISGKITGGWESVIPKEFEIYIGHRKDTISNITLSPNLHGAVFYNGKKVDSTIVIDIVPAFYMTNLQKFNAYRGEKNIENSKYKEILFDIKGRIDENCILVFGLSSRYTEIFEIGRLLTE